MFTTSTDILSENISSDSHFINLLNTNNTNLGAQVDKYNQITTSTKTKNNPDDNAYSEYYGNHDSVGEQLQTTIDVMYIVFYLIVIITVIVVFYKIFKKV